MSDKMEKRLKEIITDIRPLNESAMAEARARQDKLAKPPGSLGMLEDLSVQLAGITGKVKNHVDVKHLLVFAAMLAGVNSMVEAGANTALGAVLGPVMVRLKKMMR